MGLRPAQRARARNTDDPRMWLEIARARSPETTNSQGHREVSVIYSFITCGVRARNDFPQSFTLGEPSASVAIFRLPIGPLGVRVHQVAELALLGHAKDLLQLPSHAELRRFVARRLRPHGNPVVLRPHVHHDAANLVTLVKLLSNARKHGMQPVCIE